MIFIRGMYKYRMLEKTVIASLKTFRVVSVTGARQVGKTTLVRQIASRSGMHYISLEDPIAQAGAKADPDQWLAANPPPLAIDEIQHVPDLFRAIKRRVDDNNRSGQYLITGSALWLAMRNIGETLAGRVAILELWPFSQSEWCASKNLDLNLILKSDIDMRALRSLNASIKLDSQDWLTAAIMRGGFPEPADYSAAQQRKLWFESYLNTYLRRDVMDLVRIEHVAEYTRLIRLMSSRTAQLLNISSLARDLGLPQPTIRRYAEWLRITYQCFELAPYSVNIGKRLVKTPKHFWIDTGMTAALLGYKTWQDIESAQLSGPLIETWVVGELKKWASAAGQTSMYFWRSHAGGEIDALFEIEGDIVGMEVKTGHRLDRRDLTGLHDCRQMLGKRFRRGIIFYGGNEILPLDAQLIAVPLKLLSGVPGKS